MPTWGRDFLTVISTSLVSVRNTMARSNIGEKEFTLFYTVPSSIISPRQDLKKGRNLESGTAAETMGSAAYWFPLHDLPSLFSYIPQDQREATPSTMGWDLLLSITKCKMQKCPHKLAYSLISWGHFPH